MSPADSAPVAFGHHQSDDDHVFTSQRVSALEERGCGHTSPVALPLLSVFAAAQVFCATFHNVDLTSRYGRAKV